MKGLLLKDFYMITKYCRAFILIVALFLVISCFGNDSIIFIIYPAIFAGMIPVTLISYDEREKWNITCEILPYTRAQFVSAKYLIGLIFETAVFLLSAAAQAFRMLSTGTFAVSGYMSLLTAVFSLGIIAPAVLLPFIFRFGAEKGRIAYYIIIGILCAATTSMMGTGIMSLDRINSALTVTVVCTAAAILYALSWGASVILYKKREL